MKRSETILCSYKQQLYYTSLYLLRERNKILIDFAKILRNEMINIEMYVKITNVSHAGNDLSRIKRLINFHMLLKYKIFSSSENFRYSRLFTYSCHQRASIVSTTTVAELNSSL